AELEKLPHPHVRIPDRVFGQITDPLAGAQRLAADIDSVHAGAPGRGRGVARQRAHDGRLAGTVGAEQTHHVARFGAKRHVAHRLLAAEDFAQVLDGDHARVDSRELRVESQAMRTTVRLSMLNSRLSTANCRSRQSRVDSQDMPYAPRPNSQLST